MAWIATVGLNIHMMNDHVPSDVLQTFANDWMKDQMNYTKININYVQDQSQTWKMSLSLHHHNFRQKKLPQKVRYLWHYQTHNKAKKAKKYYKTDSK